MKKIPREFLKSQHLSTCEMKKTPREFLKSQQLSQRPARAKGGQPPSARSRIGSVKMRLFVHLLLISCLAADAGSDYAITKSSKIKTNESPSSSVRSLGQRRVLSGYVMDDSTIRTAVAAWLSDATAAEATYGHISTWETSGVTDMANLFSDAYSFNEDIGAWDTSGVTTMYQMFTWASAFDQDLGWCVDDGVYLRNAFKGTKCASTSCGVAQRDLIGICEPFGMCLIGVWGQCYINSPTLIIIIVLLALFAGVCRYVHKRKNADETYAAAARRLLTSWKKEAETYVAAARRVLCRRGTKLRATAPMMSDEAAEQSRDEPALPASMVSVVDAPAAGIAPNELGTVVSVKH